MKGHFTIGLLILIFSACTIQKRQHLNGYNIQWNKKYQSSTRDQLNEDPITIQTEKNSTIHLEKNTAVSQIDVSNPKAAPFLNTSKNVPISSVQTDKSGKIFQSNKLTNPESRSEATITSSSQNNKKEIVSYNVKKDNVDSEVLISFGIMALAAFSGYHLSRKKLKNLTRWASKNKKQARYLVTGIQLPLLGLGVLSGYNLAQMGFDLSDYTSYAAFATFGLSMGAIPFFPKSDSFILPGRLNRRRLAFLSATAAGCLMAVSYGNSLDDVKGHSYSKEIVSSIDGFILGQESASFENSKLENIDSKSVAIKKKPENKNTLRQIATIGSCIGAVFLFILLIITFCAGVCLAIGGIAGAAGAAGGGLAFAGLAILATFGGIGIAVLSILGMRAISNRHPCATPG